MTQAGLIGAFGDRIPKAVQAAVEIITQAVRCLPYPPWPQSPPVWPCSASKQIVDTESVQACSEFGCKVVPAKPILAALPKLFEAKQEPVRDAVKKLMVRVGSSCVASCCSAKADDQKCDPLHRWS